MGKYLNHVNGLNLPTVGKADAILAAGVGAKEIPQPKELIPDLVCVVENGWMDAAAWAFDNREFQDFSSPSERRRRRWLIVPDAERYAGT